MGSVILVTFAGREERMELLNKYVNKALERGLIDEWHIWDFTRNEKDHRWVTDNFGPVQFMHPDAQYQSFGILSREAPKRFDAKITNDLHIALKTKADPNHFHELVIGGWGNQACALRKLPIEQFNTSERDPTNLTWTAIFPGILSPGTANDIHLAINSNGNLTCMVNGIHIGEWSVQDVDTISEVYIKGGWGASLEVAHRNAPIQRFIGSPGTQMPYNQAYQYYATNFTSYRNDIFLKCDDDIVFMDLERLDDFIQYRRHNPNYFILSANVVNNGVCAFFQQQAGSLPAEKVGYCENPPGGYQGSLWQSGERATIVHDYFLSLKEPKLPLAEAVIAYDARISINFISWLGNDLIHLALPHGDDERFMSVDLPQLLRRPVGIYSNFVVSHLSFGIQDPTMPITRLLNEYEKLTNSI